MADHKRYVLGLVSLLFAEMLVLVGTSYYLEPLVGDMTRLGSYAENDFGWNDPQQVFVHEASPLLDSYEQYADILVVGDSFSFAGLFGMLNFPWQTFLAAETGLTIATISHYTHTVPPRYDATLIPKIVSSDAFQKQPPRILIMEIVERQLSILPDVGGECAGIVQSAKAHDLRFSPTAQPTREAQRKKERPPLAEQTAYAQKYLLGLLRRDSDETPIVSQLALTSSKLFSSKRSGVLLVYEGDIKKKNWGKSELTEIRCKLVKLQNLVQKNGKTFFVAMLVPDKLTAYSGYLQDRSDANSSVIGSLALDQSLHIPRIDKAIQAEIDAGAIDVYLPNDTHWAYRGHQTAASALNQYLQGFMGTAAALGAPQQSTLRAR
ncbi:MAG: alginate O-acetyltransferase AlgX-related protein [Candidatus Methylumidiphilus sp.]